MDNAALEGKSDWARCDRLGFFVGRWGRLAARQGQGLK